MRNLYITISPSRGVIVKNPYFSPKTVEKLVNQKANWIYKKLEELEKKFDIKKIYETEGKILYLGEKVALHVENIEKFYKEKTKEIVLREIKEISAKMELNPTKISFRKTKRRWGSCNHKNELNFTITLAQLPLNAIRYIIIHELSHIRYKNHKKEFYANIYKYMPDFKIQEKILKNYSPLL